MNRCACVAAAGAWLLVAGAAPGPARAEQAAAQERQVPGPQADGYRVRGPEIYPTLEDRELGERFESPDPERRVWGRALPFLAQKVIDLGFDLPNPYGAALVGVRIRQDLVLQDLEVAIGGGDRQPIDWVDFGQPSAEQSTAQAKLDAWVFPFMNVYVIAGQIDGKARFQLGVPGDELLGFFGLGVLCDPPIGQPADLCRRVLTTQASPAYHGTNVGVGVNLAMGWDRFFVTLPITYVWSDVNLVDTTIEALNISPRIGVTGDVGEMGVIAAFVGASYLDANIDLTGSFSFDTSGVPGLGDATTLDFKINQSNKDKWNYVVGANWDVSKRWSVMIEAGVGGSRENLMTGLTYRW